LSNFGRGQIIGVHLVGASVTKTDRLLCVLKATVSMVMSAYTNHGKTSAKINTDRKRSLYNEDCSEKSQNYCSTGNSRTEYSS
jgi:hypothetical protein